MNIEEKAKAYDKAIKIAREYWETDNDNTLDIKAKGTMEYLFPELRESEDERIRKELIEHIKANKSADYVLFKKFSPDVILTWLEKQGNQKPFDYENANIQQKDFAPKEAIPRYNIGDVLCDKSCTTLSKEEQPNFEIIDIRNGMYICDKCSFPISQQDEYELVAKRIEQKPAWSEEDEGICRAIINDIANDKSMCKFEISKRVCDA